MLPTTAPAFEIVDDGRALDDGRRPTDLHDLDAVRLEMAKVYRAMKARQIQASDGTKLVYVLDRIARVLEATLIERRVAALEALVAGGEGPR